MEYLEITESRAQLDERVGNWVENTYTYQEMVRNIRLEEEAEKAIDLLVARSHFSESTSTDETSESSVTDETENSGTGACLDHEFAGFDGRPQPAALFQEVQEQEQEQEQAPKQNTEHSKRAREWLDNAEQDRRLFQLNRGSSSSLSEDEAAPLLQDQGEMETRYDSGFLSYLSALLEYLYETPSEWLTIFIALQLIWDILVGLLLICMLCSEGDAPATLHKRETESKPKGLNNTAIVGIIFGSVAGTLLLGHLAWAIRKRVQRRQAACLWDEELGQASHYKSTDSFESLIAADDISRDQQRTQMLKHLLAYRRSWRWSNGKPNPAIELPFVRPRPIIILTPPVGSGMVARVLRHWSIGGPLVECPNYRPLPKQDPGYLMVPERKHKRSKAKARRV